MTYNDATAFLLICLFIFKKKVNSVAISKRACLNLNTYILNPIYDKKAYFYKMIYKQ